jgi:hypothetical protein
MVDVDIMPRTFGGNYIPPFVGINSMLHEKSHVGFVKYQHFRGKEKYRELVNFPVGIKAPSKNSLVAEDATQQQHNYLFH